MTQSWVPEMTKDGAPIKETNIIYKMAKCLIQEVNPFGKNFDSAFGSKSLEEMDDKTLSWAMDRLAKGKAISSRLRNILTNRGMLTPTNVGRAGQDKIPLGPISMGGTTGTTTGGGYTGPPTMDFNRAQAVNELEDNEH